MYLNANEIVFWNVPRMRENDDVTANWDGPVCPISVWPRGATVGAGVPQGGDGVLRQRPAQRRSPQSPRQTAWSVECQARAHLGRWKALNISTNGAVLAMARRDVWRFAFRFWSVRFARWRSHHTHLIYISFFGTISSIEKLTLALKRFIVLFRNIASVGGVFFPGFASFFDG